MFLKLFKGRKAHGGYQRRFKFCFFYAFFPKQDFNLDDLKLDLRFFPGLQEQIRESLEKEDDEEVRKIIEFLKEKRKKLKKKRLKLLGKDIDPSKLLIDEELPPKIINYIKEKTSINSLGDFLTLINNNAQGLSNKIRIMNSTQLKRCLDIGRQSFKDLRETTKNPSLAVKKAIYQCFELFQIPREEIKEYVSNDEETLIINNSREFSISYIKNDHLKELQFLDEQDPEKTHRYEVRWVHFNVSLTRWEEILKKIASTLTSSIIKFIAPRIGNSLTSLLKKVLESKNDELLIKACNFDLKLIFHELLRTNIAIKSVKFQNFEGELWNDEEKKKKLMKFGKELIKSTSIQNILDSRNN
ncbi:MAG: hypothetical protein ACTSUN_03960 [Promethearchaeota archaeon]